MSRGGHSVLLVPVPELEPFVRSRWEHYDPALVSTDPEFTHAHVTVLGPWLTDPSTEELAVVASIAAQTHAFEFGLAEVAAFPDGTVHLRPEPAEPFARLTAQLWAAFPDCPPYAGEFADVEPHLTLDMVGADVTLESTRAALAPILPVTSVADRIELHWYETGGCHVQARWRLPGTPKV
jgi:2'-5' RNA ligase